MRTSERSNLVQKRHFKGLIATASFYSFDIEKELVSHETHINTRSQRCRCFKLY